MFKKIIVLLVLITSIMFSQSWNSIKTTNINLVNANYAEMFSNSFGNNVILQNTNGSITYYVMNASTGLAGSAITVESSGATLAQITGEEQKVYVVYKKNSKITGKFTTDAGSNWTPIAELVVSPISLDAVYYDGRLHITYSLNNIANYYQFYNGSWINYKNVSDSETGLGPRIEVLTSQNKVYVVYDGQNGSAKSREYTVSNSTWAAKQTLYSNINDSYIAGFGVDANYIYIYYSAFDWINLQSYFYVRKIQKSNYQTVSISYERNGVTYFVQTTTTADSKVHTAYYWSGIQGDGYQSYILEPGLIHEYYNNGTRDVENIDIIYDYDNVEISSTSNDLFVIWKPSSSTILKYRQYDVAPLAPQNLTAQPTADYHPKLIWNNNTEADIQKYYVYRSTNIGYYSQIDMVTHNITTTTQSYIDNTIFVPRPGGQAGAKYYYVVSAVDLGQHISGYSNYVAVTSDNFYLDKRNIENSTMVTDYRLDQNYPNPFNPSTKISYSIKEEGLVTLKVYDVLGKEVATLVNENRPAGIYEAEFNASALPSGMYVYKIQAGSFSDVKKMLLTK